MTENENLATGPLTQAEQKELFDLFSGISGPVTGEKHNVHTFLHDIATSKDTTKTGNISKEELGMPKNPVRTYKELAIFCKDVADMKEWPEYFNAMSESTTSTSLAKEGFLAKLAVVTRKEIGDVTKRTPEKRGFFRKKEPEGGELT